MGWIGEGPHIDMLSELLRHGLLPSEADGHELSRWPQPCDPSWISEEVTPDPFFLGVLEDLVYYDQGMFESVNSATPVHLGPKSPFSRFCEYSAIATSGTQRRHDQIEFVAQGGERLSAFELLRTVCPTPSCC